MLAVLGELVIGILGVGWYYLVWRVERVALGEAVGSRDGAAIKSSGSKLSGKAPFVVDFEADLYLVADQNRKLFLVAADAQGLSATSW